MQAIYNTINNPRVLLETVQIMHPNDDDFNAHGPFLPRFTLAASSVLCIPIQIWVRILGWRMKEIVHAQPDEEFVAALPASAQRDLLSPTAPTPDPGSSQPVPPPQSSPRPSDDSARPAEPGPPAEAVMAAPAGAQPSLSVCLRRLQRKAKPQV